MLEGCERCIVVNSVANFAAQPRDRQNRLRGYEYFTDLIAFTERLKQLRHGKFRIVYTPVDVEDRAKDFDQISMLAWYVKDCVFAVDEIWLYQRSGWSPKYLSNMMLTGRHHGITLLWTAQRPAKVDATLRSVSSELYLGRMGSRLDRDAYRGDIPDDAIARLASLPDRTFLLCDDRKQISTYISK